VGRGRLAVSRDEARIVATLRRRIPAN